VDRGAAQAILSQAHKLMLKASALTDEIIADRAYRTIDDPADLEALGFSNQQAMTPALLIPVHGVAGGVVLHQLRPDTPRKDKAGSIVKYETPHGSRMVLDVHPAMRERLGDPSGRLWITEGIKKGDALVSHGECAIALLGVWNWRGTNPQGGKTALPDWEHVALNGRQTIIAFDSDVMVKAEVAKALERLGAFLGAKGAEVWYCYLPDDDGHKVGVDDFLAAGGTIDALLGLTAKELRRPEPIPGALPIIQVNNRHLRDIAHDALEAIHTVNGPAPRIFQRGSEWVRLREDGQTGGAWLEGLTPQSLPGILERYADFVTVRETGAAPARAPFDLVRDLLTLPHPGLPRISGVSGVPTFAPDGRLLAQEGFDRETETYLSLGGLEGVHADMPVADAVDLLLGELLGEFPFVDEASRAHAVAAIILPFARQMITGPTPLHLFDAPSRGTGKGLLADVMAVVATGRDAPVMSLTNDTDELEKRITSFLLAGHPIALLDNATILRAAPLAAVLTATTWQGRRLGKSEMVQVPNTATWIVTGNNVMLSDEMARRTVLARLDAQVERPEERTGWRHPNLNAWTKEHRSELVTAGLSLVRAWIDAGRPKGSGTLGRFEGWVEVMGGILGVAGVKGFLGNRDEMWDAADAEGQEWSALMGRWWQQHRELPVTAREVSTLLRDGLLLTHLWAGRPELSGLQRIGHALKAHRDRIHGGFRILAAGQDGRTGAAQHQLHQLSGAGGRNKTPETPQTPVLGTNGRGGFGETGPQNPGKTPQNPSASGQNPGGELGTDTGVSGVSGVLKPPVVLEPINRGRL